MSRKRRSRGGLYARRLRFEPLEDRRLLAGVTVGNNLDVVNGNTSSIANLISNNGGDGISLREAILAANATSGADTISFAETLSGSTISLSNGQMLITEALAIDARPLAENVTINANQLSRIFKITSSNGDPITGDFTLGGLMLTGGRTTVDESGGAILSALTAGNLTLTESTVSGNSTTDGDSGTGGGGIVAFGSGDVTLNQSTVSGNTTGSRGGGGISAYSGVVTLTQSTVSGNSALGSNGGGGGGIRSGYRVTLNQSTVSGNTATFGGGIAAGFVTLTQSTVSGNSTLGNITEGGGINAGDVTLIQSTVSGNTAGYGGGISVRGDVTLIQSTVSGNTAVVGGGIAAYYYGSVTLTQSTVTNNHASYGGGIHGRYGDQFLLVVSISGSILAGNTADVSGTDLDLRNAYTLAVNYSLIGTGITPTAGGNNIVNDNAQLGALADNGGPTQTHALLAGSPAIDAGDPGITFNPAEFDQRGTPFVRVVDGNTVPGARIDIGAFELQSAVMPPALLGDYNQNNTVDAADYVLWRHTLGTNVPHGSGADGSGNGTIDQADYDVWRAKLGNTAPPAAGAAGTSIASADTTTPDESVPIPSIVAVSTDSAEQAAASGVVLPPFACVPQTTASRSDVSRRALPELSPTTTAHDEALLAWLAARRDVDQPASLSIVWASEYVNELVTPLGDNSPEDRIDTVFELPRASGAFVFVEVRS